MSAMGQSLVKNYLHIIFSTKHRQPMIHPPYEDELHAYLGGICKNLECHPIKAGGYTDHIHILCMLSKKMSPFQGLGFAALPLHRAMPYVSRLCPFRAILQRSPEGALSANTGCSPVLHESFGVSQSPEGAEYATDGCSPSQKNQPWDNHS